MEIDITQKSQELKKFVSQFETTMFLGDISFLLQGVSFQNPTELLIGLSSPQRQLFYLAGLNISTSQPESKSLKSKFDSKDFEIIKQLLNEIEEGYEQFYLPKLGEEIDEEWRLKRMVAMPTFMSYFNLGLLNYEEQIIERIETYFKPFNEEIKQEFGIAIKDFINIYNSIDKVSNNFLMNNINKKEGDKTFKEFIKEASEKGIKPWELCAHLPENIQKVFEWRQDKGKMFRYSKDILISEFGKEKTNSFLKLFTCNRKENRFLYYTEENPIATKPIFKITDTEFHIIDTHLLIQAIYNCLSNFCIDGNLEERFYKHRGVCLENKISEVFNRFLDKDLETHKSYATQKKHEQDLLFLDKGLALVVEAKASKRDEPTRDPNSAFDIIKRNFKGVIQKGYDQTYRVKETFIERDILNIFNGKKQEIHIKDINTKWYPNSFSIIITLERFGQIQTDLSSLLEIYDDDEYPWSICIDDLEVFFLQMEEMKLTKFDLIKFLRIRERLHNRLITADELEVCGGFLTGQITTKDVTNKSKVFETTPDYADIFDETYTKKGLGFTNEKNLDIKTDPRYYMITR